MSRESNASARRPVAFVTGGTRGIGLAISQRLLAGGYDVAVNGTRPEAEVAGRLEAAFGDALREGRVIYCPGDVGADEDRPRMLERIREHFGRLDVLVNNAGVGPLERVDALETTPESFDRVLRINLRGPYFLTQAAARWMVEQKRTDPSFAGAIVNIGSISATVVSSNRGEYCISKAGFAMASQVFAVSLAPYDIPVYEVRPGITATDMTARVKEKYDRLLAEGVAIQRRWGTPDDVARAVYALVSGAFPYSTGGVFMVDGGLTVQRL